MYTVHLANSSDSHQVTLFTAWYQQIRACVSFGFCLMESGLLLVALAARAEPQLPPDSSSLSFDWGGSPWAFLVSGSPLKGVFMMEASRCKSFAKFKLHLSTTKNVQFSANNKTFIHFHALIFCFPLLKWFLC